MRWLDAQACHEFMCLSHPSLWCFAIFQYHLEFHERAQPLHSVEVNASAPDKKECSLLYHPADLTMRQRESLS